MTGGNDRRYIRVPFSFLSLSFLHLCDLSCVLVFARVTPPFLSFRVGEEGYSVFVITSLRKV